LIETEKQRRWWFATHPEFRKPERGSQERPGQRFAMSRWQKTAAGPEFFYGLTLSDVIATVRKALDYLQQNNPILMDDRDRTREQMKKVLDRATKIARIAEQIAAGHSYDKHVVEQNEFPWIRSREHFRDFIARIMKNPTEWKPLEGGRSAYWDKETGTVVVRDPRHPDGGTAFRPDKGKRYYDKDLN
jgi:hypothetical protein